MLTPNVMLEDEWNKFSSRTLIRTVFAVVVWQRLHIRRTGFRAQSHYRVLGSGCRKQEVCMVRKIEEFSPEPKSPLLTDYELL